MMNASVIKIAYNAITANGCKCAKIVHCLLKFVEKSNAFSQSPRKWIFFIEKRNQRKAACDATFTIFLFFCLLYSFSNYRNFCCERFEYVCDLKIEMWLEHKLSYCAQYEFECTHNVDYVVLLRRLFDLSQMHIYQWTELEIRAWY